MEKTAYISNIQKFCVHDGPGIRSIVFFMGCPLRCRWCQNPENFISKPVVMFEKNKCIGCGGCISACANNCNVLSEHGEIVVNRIKCIGCGECTKHCYIEARNLCGEVKTTEEIFKEVMKDEVFYRDSGGGVTLSGGEVTLYSNFASELLHRIKDTGISTAVETCGYCSKQAIAKIAEYTDLFLYDFKIYTQELHKYWTGVNNDKIKENLLYLIEMGKRVIVRIPLIPGVNDGEEFERIIIFLKSLHGIKEIHILPFHQIGSSKYALIDEPYEMKDVSECHTSIAKTCAQIAESHGFKVNIGGWDCE